MLESIIWYVSVLGTAVLLFAIGVYAERRDKPMWFWAGSSVDASEITDVTAYNKENGRMWKRFSIWFFLAGIAKIVSLTIALILLIVGGTIGIGCLIFTFKAIDKKYRVRETDQSSSAA